MANSAWKKEHKPSGATVIERRIKDCRLTVMVADWTKPKGAATWIATCRTKQTRGNARTVKAAKAAAFRAARGR
jgi:hypothetical protein